MAINKKKAGWNKRSNQLKLNGETNLAFSLWSLNDLFIADKFNDSHGSSVALCEHRFSKSWCSRLCDQRIYP